MMRGVDIFGSGFRARINFKNKCFHLGMFDTEEEAYNVYVKKYIEFWGLDVYNRAVKKW